MIGIIDYSLGNTANLTNALTKLGYKSVISRDISVLNECDTIILPGVGHYAYAMEIIEKLNLREMILELSKTKPMIGICLGMQLFFEHSEEGDVRGLGILKGMVKRIDSYLPVPHLGWNTLESNLPSLNGKNVYFVHSYQVTNIVDVIATANYATTIPAIVQRDNIIGIQFHPEKSGEIGLTILDNAIRGSFK